MKVNRLLPLLITLLPISNSALSTTLEGRRTPLSGNVHRSDSTVFRSAITVTTLSGYPLEGAQILIGSKLNEPFTGNWLLTDANGQVALPDEWNEPTAVTVHSPGFIRVTYLNVSPQALNFKLRPREKNLHIELTGKTTGFGPMKNDDTVDFGLVVPTLTKQDLFTFGVEKIISSESDIIDVAGMEAKVPSNLTIPRQTETYIIPLTLQKETYRHYFSDPGSKIIYAMHGQFPFNNTVDKLTQKVPFKQLINNFTFVSGSIRSVNLEKNSQLDLPVGELKFRSANKIIPPATLTSDKTMLTMGFFEQDGYMFPTDMHKVENLKPFSIKNLPGSLQKTLSLLVLSSEYNNSSPTKGSAELVLANSDHTSSFLDLLGPLNFKSKGWDCQPPAQTNTIIPMGTFALLSRIDRSTQPKKIERDWEFYSATWIDHLDVPEWPQTLTVIDDLQWPFEDTLSFNSENSRTSPLAVSQRWEISYVGSNQPEAPTQGVLGPEIVDQFTHVSFTYKEF